MKINVLSIFPDLFNTFLETGIVGRTQKSALLNVEVTNIRDLTSDSYGTVDDYPYGGGPGMVMKVEPIVSTLESLDEKGIVYILTPRGILFDQEVAKDLSRKETLTLICGRYKGVDERVRDFVDGEISIGNYILSGGEVAAMAIVEAIVRLLPGAVSDPASVRGDSFENGLLDCPNYTRPKVFRGREVPSILLSGNHKEIERWREKEAFKVTKKYRRDLLAES